MINYAGMLGVSGGPSLTRTGDLTIMSRTQVCKAKLDKSTKNPI